MRIRSSSSENVCQPADKRASRVISGSLNLGVYANPNKSLPASPKMDCLVFWTLVVLVPRTDSTRSALRTGYSNDKIFYECTYCLCPRLRNEKNMAGV